MQWMWLGKLYLRYRFSPLYPGR